MDAHSTKSDVDISRGIPRRKTCRGGKSTRQFDDDELPESVVVDVRVTRPGKHEAFPLDRSKRGRCDILTRCRVDNDLRGD